MDFQNPEFDVPPEPSDAFNNPQPAKHNERQWQPEFVDLERDPAVEIQQTNDKEVILKFDNGKEQKSLTIIATAARHEHPRNYGHTDTYVASCRSGSIIDILFDFVAEPSDGDSFVNQVYADWRGSR